MAKKKKPVEDGAEKAHVEKNERATGELKLEGPEMDLVKKPLTQEAWDYLCEKQETRPPLRFFVRLADLEFLAADVAKRQLTLEEVNVLACEDKNLVCAAPDHAESYEFMGVSALVIRDKEQKDEWGNYYPPIPGLTSELSRFVARHLDGNVKRHGSVFLHPKLEQKGEGERARTVLVGWTKVPMCGSRFYIGHDEEGLDVESITKSSHFGKFYHRALQQERDRAKSKGENPMFTHVFTHTDEDADALIKLRHDRYVESKAKRLEERDAWDKQFGSVEAPTQQNYSPSRRRGEGRGTHGGGRFSHRY